MHGWVNGDRHEEGRDATLGDYENFIEHMKATENDTSKVFVFDSGDHTQVLIQLFRFNHRILSTNFYSGYRSQRYD